MRFLPNPISHHYLLPKSLDSWKVWQSLNLHPFIFAKSLEFCTNYNMLHTLWQPPIRKLITTCAHPQVFKTFWIFYFRMLPQYSGWNLILRHCCRISRSIVEVIKVVLVDCRLYWTPWAWEKYMIFTHRNQNTKATFLIVIECKLVYLIFKSISSS